MDSSLCSQKNRWKICVLLNIPADFCHSGNTVTVMEGHSFPPGTGTQTETDNFMSQFPNSLFPFPLLVFCNVQEVLYFKTLFFEYEKENSKFSFSIQLELNKICAFKIKSLTLL